MSDVERGDPHAPIDYVHGPARLKATMRGANVAGFGFHERTLPLSWARELIVVLRDSLLNLPAEALIDSRRTARQLADLAWRAAKDEILRRSGLVKPAPQRGAHRKKRPRWPREPLRRQPGCGLVDIAPRSPQPHSRHHHRKPSIHPLRKPVNLTRSRQCPN